MSVPLKLASKNKPLWLGGEMKILHTSDWHLGSAFESRTRQEEYEKTLDWMLGCIAENGIRAVIIAGDVFDTSMPPSSAARMYYNFLLKAGRAGVKDIVVIAGNHDSPMYLEAPGELLKMLNVHVFGSIKQDGFDNIVELKEEDGSIAAVVCAVPFLRERDIRRDFVPGEETREHSRAMEKATQQYFSDIYAYAKAKYPDAPIIGTGHFYAAAGKTSGFYGNAGNQAGVEMAAFPAFDYLALGHLHAPQPAGKPGNAHYSGSLLQMSFADVDNNKKILMLDTGSLQNIQEIPIPPFQKMLKISGNLEQLASRIDELKAIGESIWIYASNTGEYCPSLHSRISAACDDSPLIPIGCKNMAPNPNPLKEPSKDLTLKSYTPEQVFLMLLDKIQEPQEIKDSVLAAFREAAASLEANEKGEEA